MDSYYPHCCRPPCIASLPIFPFSVYVCIHTLDYFIPAVVDFLTGEKNRIDRLFPIFWSFWTGRDEKSDCKIFRIVFFFPTRGKNPRRIDWFSCWLILFETPTRRGEKEEFEFRRYFFSRPLVVEEKSWRKENESRGTKEREERTNSSQTIKTNDPVAPLVHPPRLTAEWRLIRPNENTGGIERPSPTIAHRPTSSLNQPFLLIPFVSPNRLPRPSENRSLN